MPRPSALALTPLACALGFALAPVASAPGAPSLVERVADGIHVVRDDAGQWGGDWSHGVTHMNREGYKARKTLDLGAVPADVWDATRKVRLSLCLMVRDYSRHAGRGQVNGLDEAFEVEINGVPIRIATRAGVPTWQDSVPNAPDWFDIEVPRDRLRRGPNEVIVHKALSDKNDDYLYLAIDRTSCRGNSAVHFGGGAAWRTDTLTVPGAQGEYMVRFYLVTRDPELGAAWRPRRGEGATDDPDRLIQYAGVRDVRPGPDGIDLAAGQCARIEWDPRRFDRVAPVRLAVAGQGRVAGSWLNPDGGERNPARILPLPLALEWRPGGTGPASVPPAGVALRAAAGPVSIREATLRASIALRPVPEPIDLCPAIAPVRGSAVARAPSCEVASGSITLSNATLRCRLETGARLVLRSLRNELAATEMVRHPERVALFLVEIGDARLAGTRDFRCVAARRDGDAGARVDLELDTPAKEKPKLSAQLALSIDAEGLRLGLKLRNTGAAPVDFKVAFPHLAGLAVSADPADDYYFYPYGGGIIAPAPALVRATYGDHAALYQLMDLYAPGLGAGCCLRIDDAQAWHKTLALRKTVPGAHETIFDPIRTRTAPEYLWTNSLDAVPGMGFAVEFDRRTRAPGAGFDPCTAVIAMHPGDWHEAMQAYSAWAHRVWKFRPYPSRLERVHNMIAVGWGQSPLVGKDGRYRTDLVQAPEPGTGRTATECVELMSWWDWSPLGPWSTPFERLHEVLPEATIKRWAPYFVIDPVTGNRMWNNQPGDYDGYNERFGGLKTLRAAIAQCRKAGALATLYTDPFRLDDASKSGKAHGRQWGVVGPDGKQTTGYEVWNPCHDNPDVRRWVADTMGRVMRETGADGIRLDEYGHMGWACFSTLHSHTWSERGVSQWQKAVAEATRMVREAMDAAAPGSVLTTEHPGYDHLMAQIEGCITYDLTVLTCPLRPLECNLQRFHFPECKPYELDHRGRDRQCAKRFWNAVGAFGRCYPTPLHLVLRENEKTYADRDCRALVPGLARAIYVNRFGSRPKTIFHLYNATGHTFDGDALAFEPEPDRHAFDLLEAREAETRALPDGRRAARVYLERGAVACIALLPRLLGPVERGADGWRVSIAADAPLRPGDTIALADRSGRILASCEARPGLNRIGTDAPSAPGSEPACVKLLRAGRLLDAAR